MATVTTSTDVLSIELCAADSSTVMTLKLDYPANNLTRAQVEAAIDKMFANYNAGNTSQLNLIRNKNGAVATYPGKIEEIETTIRKTELS